MVLVSDCGVSSSLRGFAVLLGGCTIATREETWPHSPLWGWVCVWVACLAKCGALI